MNAGADGALDLGDAGGERPAKAAHLAMEARARRVDSGSVKVRKKQKTAIE